MDKEGWLYNPATSSILLEIKFTVETKQWKYEWFSYAAFIPE